MINEDEELALGYLLDPAFELTNTAGKPLTDGWINVYVHGTRNKYYCYSDWNGNLHPFNIPLDGLGSNIVLASPQFTYDVYVYNKYGTLQMSRYNVSPVGVGEVSVSGINEIVSNDGTVEISQYGDTFDLSVPDITAVSGLVEDVAELTTAVSSIQEELDDLSSAVSGKKDKQEPYSFSETNRYTVSSLSQNADGKVTVNSTKSVGSEYTIVHAGTTSNKFAKIAEFSCYSGFSYVGSGFTNLVISVSDADGARQAMISVGLTQAANGNHNFAAPLRFYVSLDDRSTFELKEVYLFSDTPYGNSQVQSTISLWAEFTSLSQKMWTFKAENNYSIGGTGSDPKANVWSFANGKVYPTSALPTGGWRIVSRGPEFSQKTPDWNAAYGTRSYIANKPDLTQYVTQEELATAVSALSVQSDWEQSDSTKPDYIKNKPDMSDYVTQEELVTAVSGLGVQSDWTEQDSDSPAYIQNKPVEKDLVAGDGIDITVSGTSVIISSDNPAVTGYATEIELATVSGALQLEIETVSANPRVKVIEYGVDRLSDVVAAMNGVASGKYDYVVAKYTSNGTDLYAPLVKYEAGTAAFFVCPDHVSDNAYGYGERRVTEVFIINASDIWIDRKVRPFLGKLIGRGNVSITVQGEDYIVSGAGGTFEQVNADWNAVSGAAEILNKPTIPAAQVNSDWDATSGIAEILNKPEVVGVSAGSGIDITETASGIVISCTVTGGPGSSYTAGDYIDITNDTISVTGITDLVAGNAITITSSGSSAIISSTGEAQVQSDWDVTDSTSKAYIKNKPTIPAAQVQSNWNETNTSSKAYIQNKPTIHTYTAGDGIDITSDVVSLDDPVGLVAGNNITIEVTGVSAIISSTGGGGGGSYSAGSGIDITNDVISAKVDGTTMGINASGCLVSNKKFADLTYNSSTWADFSAAYTKLQNGEIDGIRVVNSSNNTTFYADYVYSTKSLYGGALMNAVFVAPAFAVRTSGDYKQRRATRIYTLDVNGTWTSEYSYGFDGKIIAGSNVTVTASGSDYIVSAQGGGTSYSAGNMISLTNNTISVSTTAGITDIQQVAALPANPVSSVLYLIPET